MPKVNYEQTLIRVVEVNVSDEQMAALKDHDIPGNDTTGRLERYHAAVEFVQIKGDEIAEKQSPEWVGSYCTGDNDEELFDV